MIRKVRRQWASAKAQSEISEPKPYRARNRQPQIIDDGMQPKPAICALSRACIACGTGSSNPSPSSGESTNFLFLFAPHAGKFDLLFISDAHSRAEPVIRIHLPPAESRANFTAIPVGTARSQAVREARPEQADRSEYRRRKRKQRLQSAKAPRRADSTRSSGHCQAHQEPVDNGCLSDMIAPPLA